MKKNKKHHSRAKHNYSKADYEQVLALFKLNFSVNDISSRLKTPRSSVYGILNFYNKDKKPIAERQLEFQIDYLISDYGDYTVTPDNCNSRYGHSWNAILKILTKYHIHEREPIKVVKEYKKQNFDYLIYHMPDNQLVDLKENGFTYQQIADFFDTSMMTIRRHILKLNPSPRLLSKGRGKKCLTEETLVEQN